MTSHRIALPRAAWVPAALLALTVGQLAVAALVPGLEQFEGKGFTGRLILYPVMMLLVPAIWWLGHRGRAAAAPWAAFAWIMLPFLVDVTGNTLDLYDAIWWWDDANHLVNWLFLSLGVGLLLTPDRATGTPPTQPQRQPQPRSQSQPQPQPGSQQRPRRPGWETALLVAGIGAIVAIGWEVGEYYAFIRGGTELATAYTDTLGDEVLGTLGATIAGLITAYRRRPRP